jgi:protein O-mannosyl-transferase
VRKIQRPRTARQVREAQSPATPPSPAKTSAGIWRPHGRYLLVLWAFVLLAYSNSFHAALQFDNVPILLQDPRIRDASAQNINSILTRGYWYNNPDSGLYRPLVTLSYLMNYAVLDDGPNPVGYHIINLVLHGVNVTLVYGLGLLIFSEPSLGLALGAIWGLHPLLTESVTNIVGRADELAAFGVLAGLLCYTRWTQANGRRKLWWLAAMVAVQAIGLFSKENAAVLPGILLLYDLIFSDRVTWRARVPAYAALVLPFLLFLVFRSQVHSHMVVPWSENPMVNSDFWTARFTAIKVIGKYLWLFIWPARLSADYSYNAFPLFGWKLLSWEDDKTLIALAVALGAITAAVVFRRSWKAMSFFIAFFFLTLLPAANLIIIAASIMAERFLYLPSVGLAGCLVAAIYALGRRMSSSWQVSPKAAWITMALASLAFAARTYARNIDWHDELSLWSSTVEVCPGVARAHMNLGDALAKIPGHQAEAIAEYRTALRIRPDYSEVHYDLGTVFEDMPGRLPDAITEFQAAIKLQPDFAGAYNNLGNALSRTPMRLNDAITEWQAAARFNPDYADPHYNLGNAYSQMPGRLADAIVEYQTALRIDPGLSQAHNNLANALAQTPGRIADAILEWREALRLQPNLVQAHVNLGTALAQIPGQRSGAITELEAALRIQPDPQVQQMLDRLLKAQ